MSFTNSAENSALALIFNATAWANVADNAASSPLTNLYVSLHTADPGDAGSQTTSETAYTNYARVAVARTSGGWTVSGTDPTQVANTATVTFAQCGVTGATLTHFGIGSLSSGAGVLYARGTLGTAVGDFTNDASNNVISPNLSFSVDDRVALYHNQGGTPGTGITEGTVYWVKTAAAPSYTLSTTQGGATLTISAIGSGYLIKAGPLTVATLGTPSFAANALKSLID